MKTLMEHSVNLNAKAPPGDHSLMTMAKLLGPLLVFMLLMLAINAVQPAFLSGSGPRVLVYQAIPVLILALGQSLVILTGGIDLSNAALAVLAGVLVASGLEPLGASAVVLTIVGIALIGVLHGVLVAVCQVPSLAITLGLFGFWQAVALLITKEQTLYIGTNSAAIEWLNTEVWGVQAAVYVGVLLTIVLWLALRYTLFGRELRALGFNECAALMSGIRTRMIKIAAFALSAAFSAVAGIVLTAQQGTASASGLGVGLLLPAIAAAVVGGTSISGGLTNPLNVAVGALVVTLIPMGAVVVGFDPRVQQVVFGVMMIVAVFLTIDRKKQSVLK